jgi:hypothetical protein
VVASVTFRASAASSLVCSVTGRCWSRDTRIASAHRLRTRSTCRIARGYQSAKHFKQDSSAAVLDQAPKVTTSARPRADTPSNVPKTVAWPDSDIRDLPVQAPLRRARNHDRVTCD